MEEQRQQTRNPVCGAAIAAVVGMWAPRRWRHYNTNKIRTAPPERRRFPVPR